MSYTVIAPVGDNLQAIFIGMKEFPTERVVLVSETKNLKEADGLKRKLEDFTIPTEIIEIEGNLMGEMFKIFGGLCSKYEEDKILVNVATGDKMSTCAALSASFANGLKAIGVEGGKTMVLPIIKLSYYNELSDSKLNILENMDTGEFVSMQELSKKLDMSISLLSYHINGNYKYKGLKDFRLVDVKSKSKNLYVRLSKMGELILKGYIKRK